MRQRNAVSTKDPWEMTKKEWSEHAQSMHQFGRRGCAIYEDDQFHEDWIRKRLHEGKPVPPEVLADYPDLVPEAPAEAPPTEKAQPTPAA